MVVECNGPVNVLAGRRVRVGWQRGTYTMPIPIKILVSLAVAVVAISACLFREALGLVIDTWYALGLGSLMILSMWLFPETRGSGSRS